MRKMIGAVAVATAIGAAWPANASILLNIGAGVLQPEENLLFNNNPPPGFTIEGQTNQTGTFVTALADGAGRRPELQGGGREVRARSPRFPFSPYRRYVKPTRIVCGAA